MIHTRHFYSNLMRHFPVKRCYFNCVKNKRLTFVIILLLTNKNFFKINYQLLKRISRWKREASPSRKCRLEYKSTLLKRFSDSLFKRKNVIHSNLFQLEYERIEGSLRVEAVRYCHGYRLPSMTHPIGSINRKVLHFCS